MLTNPGVRQKHLLLPSHPTPNGRLHLGHIAGPYLKMDVLKRVLQRRGDHAILMFSVDSFDSYVLLRAHQLRSTPADVAARYTKEILEDLAALDIGLDDFLDPLSASWSASYRDSVLDTIQSMRRSSWVETQQESFLYSPSSSRFIVGAWLRGRCPKCNSEAGGFSCEICACHYRPEELLEKQSRVEEERLDTVSCRTLFMRVRDLETFRQRIEEKLPAAFRTILLNYLKRSGPMLRISIPGTWGVPLLVEGESQPQVVYTGFASLGLLRACGRQYARRFGTKDPFLLDSDVTITCSFGIDNVVTRMLSCVGGLLHDANLRPPDSLLLNYFYQLEGAKFSTSRNHAIWASTIAALDPTISDTVRYYLLETAPEQGPTDFRVMDFLQAANELFAEWRPLIEAALGRLFQAPCAAPDSLLRLLGDTLKNQEGLLQPGAFHSSKLPGTLREWIRLSHGGANEFPYWWLKAFSVVAWPVLPKLGLALWHHLGHKDLPAVAEFPHLTAPRTETPVRLFHQVSQLELQTCLPNSL